MLVPLVISCVLYSLQELIHLMNVILILLSYFLLLQFSGSLPKCASTAAQRHLKSGCMVSLNRIHCTCIGFSMLWRLLTFYSYGDIFPLFFWWRVMFSWIYVQAYDFIFHSFLSLTPKWVIVTTMGRSVN